VDPRRCRRRAESMKHSRERTSRSFEIAARAPACEQFAPTRPPGQHQLVVALVQEMPADNGPEQHQREALVIHELQHHYVASGPFFAIASFARMQARAE